MKLFLIRKYIYKNRSSLLSGFIFGLIVAISVSQIKFSGSVLSSPISADSRLDTGKYKFIKPILNSGYGNEEEALKWFPAERKLKSLVEDIVSERSDIKTGVFFLNLNNSGWFSVNASDTFIPASLLKLPMLISYYKLNELEKDLFDQKIFYQGKDFNTLKNLGNGTIIPGNTYTIKELMNEMIINSDNNALQLLYKYRQDSLKSIFSDMKIPLPNTDGEIAEKDFVTTRDIARFLLVLYNASYLSPEDSEEALNILSRSVFKEGIVAGVPSDVVVSHKFGERELAQKDNGFKIELHDCGIIYYPKNPYILCVMTKGSDLESEKIHIQKISKVVYTSVTDFANNLNNK
jgi:beta-lactamase class A